MNSITHAVFVNQPSRKHLSGLGNSRTNPITSAVRLRSNSFNPRNQFNSNQVKLYLHSLT